jgi:hypothetical protein
LSAVNASRKPRNRDLSGSKVQVTLATATQAFGTPLPLIGQRFLGYLDLTLHQKELAQISNPSHKISKKLWRLVV